MNLIDKAEALAPCPFCGGVAEQDYQQPYRSLSAGKLGKACTIYCTECSANVILCHEDHPGVSPDDLMTELVAAWNRRAALPARGVGVKPLEWKETNGVWTAKTIIGEYTVCFDDGLWCELSGPDYWDWQAPEDPRSYSGPHAAQLAAQADYETRILAALSPAAQPGADVAAQAREAALSVFSGLSSYLGAGLGDDTTTAEQFDKRIRWAIDDLTARTRQAALREAINRLRAAPMPKEADPGLWVANERAIALLEVMIGEART